MKKIKKQLNNLNKTAIYCLSFVILFTVTFFGLKSTLASWVEPSVAPPMGNLPLLIDIGGTPQAKEGYLRIDPSFNILGEIPNLTHALEVKGEGALIGNNTDVTKGMQVDTNTLVVDSNSHNVGIGIDNPPQKLTIRSNEHGLFSGLNTQPIPQIAVAGFSNDNTGISGITSANNYSAIYGVTTFSSSSSAGVWGKGKGVGVYGLSVNGVGLWAESNSVDYAALFGKSLSGQVFHWSNIENVSNSLDHSKRPSLAVDSFGNPHIAWEENEEILYKYREGGAWKTKKNLNISNTSLKSYNPSIDVDSKNNPHIAWSERQSNNKDDIYYTYWNPEADGGNGDWVVKNNINISNNTGDSRQCDLTLDSKDNPHIVWHDDTGGNYDIYYIYWNAANNNWSSVENISSNSEDSALASLALDSNDNPHITWQDTSGISGNYDIYYKYWDGIQWSVVITIISNDSDISTVANLVLDSLNYPHISWESRQNAWPGEIYYKYWDGSDWEIKGSLNISNTLLDSTDAKLSLDTSGNPHIIWEEEIFSIPPVQNIYYKYWNPQANNGLGDWVLQGDIKISTGLSYCTGGNTQLVIDSDDKIHAAWSCGVPFNVYYLEGDPFYNASPTFAGYFQGRLGSTDEVIGTKFLPTKLQNSLVPYASGFKINDYDVGSIPQDIVFDGTYLWVARTGITNLLKIRASDGVEVNHYDINGGASNLLFDGSNIWITNGIDNKLTKFSVADGVITQYNVGLVDAINRGMTFDGTDLWVASINKNSVSRFRVLDGKEFNCDSTDPGVGVITRCPVGAGPVNIIYDGKYLWVTNYDDYSVSQLWASVGTEAQRITLGPGTSPQGLVFDGTYVWVTCSGTGKVSKIRAEDGEEINKYTVGSSPSDITFEGTYLWVANAGENTVSKIRVADGKELNCDGTDPGVNPPTRCPVGTNPQSIIFDGTYIWTANKNSNNLSKLYSGTGWGHTDLSSVINLSPTMPSTPQTGSFSILGSGEIKSNLEVGGNLSADGNAWGGSDETVPVSGDETFNCSNGRYLKGITTDANGKLSQLICRQL